MDDSDKIDTLDDLPFPQLLPSLIENVATLAFFMDKERSESRDQVRRRHRLAAVSTKTVVKRRYSF
jgi:hypothetical protein